MDHNTSAISAFFPRREGASLETTTALPLQAEKAPPHPAALALAAAAAAAVATAAVGVLSFGGQPLATGRLAAGLTLGLLLTLAVTPAAAAMMLGGALAGTTLAGWAMGDQPASILVAAGCDAAVAAIGYGAVSWKRSRLRKGEAVFTPWNAVAYSLTAALLASPAAAILGPLGVAWLEGAAVTPLAPRLWWVYSLMGLLLVTPLVLACDRRLPTSVRPFPAGKGWVPGLAIAAGLLISTSLVFGNVVTSTAVLPYPFLLWATIRFGFRGATLALAAFAASALGFSQAGMGVFVRLGTPTPETALNVGWFLVMTAATFQTLAAAAERQWKSAARLRRMNATLEAHVRQRTAELEKTAGALRDRERRKDEFLAMLGHELRNPLAGVAGSADLLARDAAADRTGRGRRLSEFERRECLDVVTRQSTLMRRLVDDLLEVGRLNTGKLRLRMRPLDLRSILEETAGAAEPLAVSAGVSLKTQFEEGEWPVEGDADRLAQVFHNLLTNAVKFSGPSDRVLVRGRVKNGVARVEVIDEGVGMSPEEIASLFEPFAQAETSLDRSRGGLGLGLTLARRLMELHGGTVNAQSDGPGAGSRFVVTMPTSRRRARTKAGSDSDHSAARALDVLVIDDSPAAAFPVIKLSELAGHTVRSAGDAYDGLIAARERRPDLICCDIGLPGMDGYQFAQAVRKDPELAGVRLVAITGYGTEEDRRAALAAGFDEHIAKPVSAGALRRVWAKVEPAEPVMA